MYTIRLLTWRYEAGKQIMIYDDHEYRVWGMDEAVMFARRLIQVSRQFGHKFHTFSMDFVW